MDRGIYRYVELTDSRGIDDRSQEKILGLVQFSQYTNITTE